MPRSRDSRVLVLFLELPLPSAGTGVGTPTSSPLSLACSRNRDEGQISGNGVERGGEQCACGLCLPTPSDLHFLEKLSALRPVSWRHRVAGKHLAYGWLPAGQGHEMGAEGLACS